MAGYREFAVGEVLTSSNVNEFLMNQSVMVFADSAARGSALGTAAGTATALTEGMVTYLNDIDEVQFFDGSVWARVGLPIGTATPSSGQVLVFDGGSSTWVPRSGSVLQVVNGTTTSELTITSTGFTATNLTASITPLYSTSKVLVIAESAAEPDAGTSSSYDTEVGIFRDGTELVAWRVDAITDGNIASTTGASYLDSPATTSSATYDVRARLVSSGSSRKYTAQRNGATSTITLMEIAA